MHCSRFLYSLWLRSYGSSDNIRRGSRFCVPGYCSSWSWRSYRLFMFIPNCGWFLISSIRPYLRFWFMLWNMRFYIISFVSCFGNGLFNIVSFPVVRTIVCWIICIPIWIAVAEMPIRISIWVVPTIAHING